MSAMLNLLPKILQNILTQNCFYYNILQLLFPFWHVFSAFFAVFPVNATCLPLVWRMCFVLILCRILQELTDTFRTRHNKDSALFRADTSKNNVLEKPQKRRLHADRTSDKICEKRLTGYKKLQNGNVGRKMQEKQKMQHTRLLSTAPPLPQKRKQNCAQSFGKFFAYCSFPKNSVNVTQKFAKHASQFTKNCKVATLH